MYKERTVSHAKVAAKPFHYATLSFAVEKNGLCDAVH
jgi:hypothetical protein